MADLERMLLEQHYREILCKIANAVSVREQGAGTVQMVAVSKGQTVDAIRVAYALGIRDFGESYVQEWRDKAAALVDLPELRWHFIGHLQSNKVKYLGSQIDTIHSVDRLALITALAKSSKDNPVGGKLKVLLQLEVDPTDVNKFGVSRSEAAAICPLLAETAHFEWCGFMGIGPADQEDAYLRKIYTQFVASARELWEEFAPRDAGEPIISLGMSDDFEVAIACGANLVRVGSILFGARPAPIAKAAKQS